MKNIHIEISPRNMVILSTTEALMANQLYENIAYECHDGVVNNLSLEYEEGDTDEGKS
jgi:hypothetical protein